MMNCWQALTLATPRGLFTTPMVTLVGAGPNSHAPLLHHHYEHVQVAWRAGEGVGWGRGGVPGSMCVGVCVVSLWRPGTALRD